MSEFLFSVNQWHGMKSVQDTQTVAVKWMEYCDR